MEVVKCQLEAPLAVVTLHRPACRNALNTEVYQQLEAILRRIEAMAEIRVVILTGAGEKAFAAGADIAEMAGEGPEGGRRLSPVLCHRVGDLLENMRQVTIAAVNGYALGGGCERPGLRPASGGRKRPLRPAGGGPGHPARRRRDPAAGRLIGGGAGPREMIFTGTSSTPRRLTAWGW